MTRGKHSFLPLTRLDHRQYDAEFEAAFDVKHVHGSVPVSIMEYNSVLPTLHTNILLVQS